MFQQQEERLQALVKRAETPVLGLLGSLLPADDRMAIRADLAVMPSAKSYAQRLDKYPALFGVWLAEHIMLGLGQDGHFSLYPHIQKAIGVTIELTSNEKESLGIVVWGTLINADFVKTTAFAYATALLATCDSQHLSAPKQKTKNLKTKPANSD